MVGWEQVVISNYYRYCCTHYWPPLGFWTRLVASSPVAVDPQGHALVDFLPLPLLLHSIGILYGVCTPPPLVIPTISAFLGSLERLANGAQKAQIVTSNILKSKLSSAYFARLWIHDDILSVGTSSCIQ